MACEPDPRCTAPIGVTDMIRDPWIGFAIFVMFVRACTLGAIAAHLASSEYGAGLGLLYALAKLGEFIVDERAKMYREHAAGA